MPEIVKIKVDVTGNGKSDLTLIKKQVDYLNKTPVKIDVQTTGDTKAIRAMAQLEAAKAKIIKSENDLKIAQERTKQSEQNRIASETKLATQMEKTATAEESARAANARLQQQIEKTTTEEKKLAVQQEKTKTATENRAKAEINATNATKQLGTETEKTAKKTESLWDNFTKFARWYIIGNAFSSIVRSMREAFDTMKAVDDELVTIRKVTGFSDSQIAEVKGQAYSTASAYGVGAADYLASVAAFARAGYKEQSAALAELSTKTQIVGDTTAQTANQFLLSVDAAYQYKGSIEALSRVLDGANEIDNKYATSIEKIADGMGIVAPVASQMNVTIDELAAAIGTITAVTQRSGSEAARALRALFLNIAGDTKTEIDEGVTWTTGEIAGLRDVIKLYAKDAYDAAQATGSIIDPMRAMEGLAKSMQEGVLTEQKLIEMVSDIGGKLRTSQLLAIIQNWDMYQSMLQDYAGAIGSADKEVENALDSWTRKTNQLKNEWAEFVSHLIDSKEIKVALDFLIGFVNFLDSGVGKVSAYALAIMGVVAGIIKLGAAIKALNLALATNPLYLLAAGAAAAIIGIVEVAKAMDDLTSEYDEQKEKLDDLNEEYNRLYGPGSEYAQLLSNAEKLTDQEERRLAILEAQADKLARQRDEQQLLTFHAWRDQTTTTTYEENGYAYTIEESLAKVQADSALSKLQSLTAQYDAARIGAAKYKSGLQELVRELQASAEAIQSGKEAGAELNEEERELLYIYNLLVDKLAGYNKVKKDNTQETVEQAEANEALKTALEEVEKNSSLTYGTLEELDKLYPGLSEKILDASGNLTKEGQEALSSKDAFILLIGQMIAFNNTGLDVSGKIEQLRALAQQAGLTGAAISMALGASEYQSAVTDYMDIYGVSRADAEDAIFNEYYAHWSDEVGSAFKNKDYIKAPPGGGGGGSSQSVSDKALETRKNTVALLKQELSFLKESGASASAQVEKMRQIQDALHDQAEYMRSIGADETEILSLSTEWWSYQNKITKALEDANDALDKLKNALKEAEDSSLKWLDTQKDAAVGPLQEQLDVLKAQKDVIEDAREEEEKLLAVEQARIALENAQRERTVRQYNAATGQWEWVANAQNVAAARESLAAAEQALDDYYKNRAISALEKNISTIQGAYDKLGDAIKKFADEVEAGNATFLDAYTYLANAVANMGLQGQLNSAIQSAAGIVAGNFQNAGESTIIDQMKRNSAAWWGASESERKDLADANLALGTSQGWHRGNDGVWYDAFGTRVYDSGGILRGIGGIKATRDDEMVLPPAITGALLNAEQTGAFDALLHHLGIVTAAARSYAGFGGSVARSSIGSQYNGDNFYINGQLVHGVTEATTLGQLAQIARTLNLRKGS